MALDDPSGLCGVHTASSAGSFFALAGNAYPLDGPQAFRRGGCAAQFEFPAVEPFIGEADDRRVRTEVEIEKDRSGGNAGRCQCEATPVPVAEFTDPAVRQIELSGDDLLAASAERSDVDELFLIPDYQGAFPANEERKGRGDVALRCLVDDDQVEQAGFQGQIRSRGRLVTAQTGKAGKALGIAWKACLRAPLVRDDMRSMKSAN